MLNYCHSLFYRPERGWDPVEESHVRKYADAAWSTVDFSLIDRLREKVGGFENKRILDLGGGAGQYAISFAEFGARVTWHDISRRYMEIAKRKAASRGVHLEYSLGYLEAAIELAQDPFDLVFSRVCWNYCMSDRRFARIILQITRPGGAIYVETANSTYPSGRTPLDLRHLFDRWLGIKIGHPYPPRGRIAAIFQKFPLAEIEVDYRSPVYDKLFLVKV